MRSGLRVFAASGCLGTLSLISATLAGSSQIPATAQEGPESGPDPSYRDVIATYLKITSKKYNKYEAFEISAPRRVRSFHGLDWISCVRFWMPAIDAPTRYL